MIARASSARLMVLALACASCVRPIQPAAPTSAVEPPQPDSITVGLWHMDESVGTRVADAGPSRLDGTCGTDVHPRFGRFGNAREFVRSLDSFVYVPYQLAIESPVALTIEAWLNPRASAQMGEASIASRWSDDVTRQSWMLAATRNTGRLLFTYLPEGAGAPLTFASAGLLETGRWTHVAVTFDGEAVRFYLDGVLDAQYATSGRIRPSGAALLIGNAFDTRYLTGFQGTLHLDPLGDSGVDASYDGLIDELRISSAARQDFPKVVTR